MSPVEVDTDQQRLRVGNQILPKLGDEVGLHIHSWTDFVRDARVTARTAPNWAGRSDGYDVPLTAFDESETRRLIDRALQLMSEHGLPKPTSFRGGGLFANAANLRAVAAAGFTADTSGAPAGPFGQLLLPWTLPKDAQPYRPSANDANALSGNPRRSLRCGSTATRPSSTVSW